jgi:hypothetical protein
LNEGTGAFKHEETIENILFKLPDPENQDVGNLRVAFTRPYFGFDVTLVVRRDRPLPDGLAGLRGRRVGTLGGSLSHDVVVAAPGLDVVLYEGTEEPYLDLEHGLPATGGFSCSELPFVPLDDKVFTAEGIPPVDPFEELLGDEVAAEEIADQGCGIGCPAVPGHPRDPSLVVDEDHVGRVVFR